MIAADSSVIISYLDGDTGRDIDRLAAAFSNRELTLPPPVLTELLSAGNLPAEVEAALDEAPLMALTEGYWRRAGEMRHLILSKGLKARLADCLIAQCCIDAAVPLLARDSDFRHFAKWCGLELAE